MCGEALGLRSIDGLVFTVLAFHRQAAPRQAHHTRVTRAERRVPKHRALSTESGSRFAPLVGGLCSVIGALTARRRVAPVRALPPAVHESAWDQALRSARWGSWSS